MFSLIAGLWFAPVGASEAIQVEVVESPAGANSRWPRLDVSADQVVRLSWVQELESGNHALRFSSWIAEGFQDARTVASGDRWFVNWADFPSVVGGAGDTLAAHWLEKMGEDTYAYGIRVACSSDGGERWSEPFWLHRDETPAEHGFATLVATEQGFAAVWLDGRDMPSGGDMSLRATTFDVTGKRSDEVILDTRTCECCATDAVSIGGNLVTIYRDRGDDERRDIALAWTDKGRWSQPIDLHRDAWITPG